tara:strand:- start:50 stop:6052 length:6003 start_codon:yes stop_codon:yes gene_type:complete
MATSSITSRDRRRFAPANAYRRGLGNKFQTVSVTDLISEGPIEGLSESEGSVFLDGDPLTDRTKEAIFSAEKYTITVNATGANAGVTVYENDVETTSAFSELSETGDSDTRYIFIYNVKTINAKILQVTQGSWLGIDPATLVVEDTDGNDSFLYSYVADSANISNAIHRVRVKKLTGLNKGGQAKYIVNEIRDTENASASTSGSENFAKLEIVNNNGSGLGTLFDPEEDVDTDVEIQVDVCFQVKISSSKVLTLVNNTLYTTGLVKRKFAISGTHTADNQTYKVEDSSVQFRTGTVNQAPLVQLAGVGVASKAVQLSTSDTAVFQVIGQHHSGQAGQEYFRNAYTTNAGQEAWTTVTSPGSGSGGGGNKTVSRITLQTRVVTLSANMSAGEIAEIDQLRLQYRYPSGLYHTGGSGDLYSQAAGHEIHVYFKRDGVWRVKAGQYIIKTLADSAKQKTAFSKDVLINNLEAFQPYEDIRVLFTRLTPTGVDNPRGEDYDCSVVQAYTDPNGQQRNIVRLLDSNNSSAIDSSALVSIVAIVKEKLNYPHTALATVTFNSRDYSSVPVRTYDVLGKKVKIPSNYTPRHLTTSGEAEYKKLWDGSFSDENLTNQSGLSRGLYYTDNPAWVFYDMLTNDRYGLGHFLKASDIDKFALYKIAKYCDELVADGKGGLEPRFRANIYLTKATDSYKVLKDMATVFRGMLYWLGGQVLTIQDSPSPPIYNFGKANIIDNEIKVETTGSKTRINQVIVSWNNPASSFKLEPLIVEDRQNILDTGRIIKEEANAFGCTSEGQAIRYGKWKLWTAVNQTEIISFKTGINAGFIQPGDVINVQNSDDFDILFSGRVSSSAVSSGATVLTLDRNIGSLTGTSTYTLSALVDIRKVVLAQDSATINTDPSDPDVTTNYVRGDTIESAYIPTSTTDAALVYDNLLDGFTDEEVKKHIVLAETKASSGESLLLELVNGTTVETREFNSGDVNNSGEKTIITFDSMSSTQSAQFTGSFSTDSIWVIKHVTNVGATSNESYKEYKVLGITEEDDGAIGITAAEYSTSKFSAVDREFELDVADVVYPEATLVCPAPPNVYLLRASVPGGLDEIIVQWDRPLADDGTFSEDITGYDIKVTPTVTDNELIRVNDPGELKYALSLENGVYQIGVRAVGYEKLSSWVYREILINDPYGNAASIPRLSELAIGVKSDFEEFNLTGTTFKLVTTSWAMVSNGDNESSVLINPSTTTTASHTQDLTSMQHASLERAYIVFDRTPIATHDYLLLAGYKLVTFENTQLDVWFDVTNYAPSSGNAAEANRWTHVNANVSVPTGTGNNIVTKTGGDAAFLTDFKVGDIIRLNAGGNPNKIYAAKVAYIESDSKLFTDRALNTSDSTLSITANSSTKTVTKAHYTPDPVEDGIMVEIKRDGTTYTAEREWIDVIAGIRGRAVTAGPTIHSLNYNADNSMVSNQYTNIELTAEAINFVEPMFKVTGDFQSGQTVDGEEGTVDSVFKDPTSGTSYTKRLNNSTAIAYNSGAPLVFTVTVQEKNDATKQQTTTVSIGKIREGTQGNSTALIYLYKNAASASAADDIDSNFPTVTVTLSGTGGGTITSASGVNIVSDQIGSTGWYRKPQTPAEGQATFIVASTANSSGSSDTIAYNEWSDPPIQFSGFDGLKSATVELFQLNNSDSTPPADPSGNLEYTFSTAKVYLPSTTTASGGAFNGWTQAGSSPTSSNKYLWKITAAAIANAAKDTIPNSEWSDAILAAQYGAAGATGPAGLRTVQGFLYYEKTTSGAPPSPEVNLYNFANGIITAGGSGTDAVGTGTNVWTNEPRTQDPTSSNVHWTVRYSGTEASQGSENVAVTYGNIVQYTNFSGVVTFNSGTNYLQTGGNNITTIDGGGITTGVIHSAAWDTGSDKTGTDFAQPNTNATSTSRPSYFNLDNGAIATEQFKIDRTGSAEFKGTLKAAGFSTDNTMSGEGNLTIGSPTGARVVISSNASNHAKITIHDSSSIRVKLGYLGS